MIETALTRQLEKNQFHQIKKHPVEHQPPFAPLLIEIAIYLNHLQLQ